MTNVVRYRIFSIADIDTFDLTNILKKLSSHIQFSLCPQLFKFVLFNKGLKKFSM